MFSQSADEPATDQPPAPIGMRELPPQPAKPVMPAYATTTPEPVAVEAGPGPGPEDSVIAKDDHLEGTFTSRGTVVVMGSVKGRIEAVQVRIEDGAKVDADVIVDEAIIAGEFTGNLTCRDRLEARASGRINGRVETFKLMLHEGASVEGEMHMLTESPKDASATIRGSAPLRGEKEPGAKSEDKHATTAASVPAATRPAPAVTPSSSAKASAAAGGTGAAGGNAGGTTAAAAPSGPSASAATTSVEARTTRSSVAETLRAETMSMRVAPRTTTASRGYGGPARGSANGSRNGTTTTGF